MGLVLKVATAAPLQTEIPLLLLHVWALHLPAPQINKPMSSFTLLPRITPQANKIQRDTAVDLQASGSWM
jgi:hypothetical protein